MSSTAPDYIPDDTSPDYIPDDTPEYIPGDDQTEEQRKHFDLLNALGKPLPGLELNPLERFAQWASPVAEPILESPYTEAAAQTARQIGGEFTGAVGGIGTDIARLAEMYTHPEGFAAAMGSRLAGIPEAQIPSATPASDRLASFVQGARATVGLNEQMPGPGLGEIVQNPARLTENPIEIPQAIGKFMVGAAPYTLMPELGGASEVSKLARTIAAFTPTSVAEPLSRGDVLGALESAGQNAIGLAALHAIGAARRIASGAPPEFRYTPYDRTAEAAAPEKLPPETPVAPAAPEAIPPEVAAAPNAPEIPVASAPDVIPPEAPVIPAAPPALKIAPEAPAEPVAPVAAPPVPEAPAGVAPVTPPPEAPVEAPGVPQDRSGAAPPPVQRTPEQLSMDARAIAYNHYADLPRANAKYVEQPDGSVQVNLPSGRHFVLATEGSIDVPKAAVAAYLKLHPEQTGMNFEAPGVTNVVDGNVVQTLSRSVRDGTVNVHEGEHVVEALGLQTPEEHAALANHFAPGETDPTVISEKIAEGVESAPPPGLKAQIVNGLNRFGDWLKTKGYQAGFIADKPLPNVARLIEDARTGRAMARKTAPGAVAPEGASFKLRERDANDPLIQKNLVDTYGTTDDNTRRGWVLPDGRLVPLKPGMTHEETQWNDGMPHLYGEPTIKALTSRGIIRVDPQHGGYEIGTEPTPEQTSRLRSMMESNPAGANFFDLHDNRNTPSPRYAGLEGNMRNPDVSLGQVARFYRGEELQQRLFKIRPKVEDTSLIDSPERRAARAKWTEELETNRGFADPRDASHKVRPQQRAFLVVGDGDAVRIAHREGAVMSDPTEAANLIPERARFGDMVDNEARNIANDVARRAIEKGQNVVVNHLTPEEADGYEAALKQAGYTVTRTGVPEGVGVGVQQEAGRGARPAGGQGTTEEGRVRPAPEADRGDRVPTEEEARAEGLGGVGPGTQRGGTRGVTAPDIKQLQDTLDGIKLSESNLTEPPKPEKPAGAPLAERAKAGARSLAQKYSGTKDYTPLDALVGNWTGERDIVGHNAAMFARKIVAAIPDRLTRQAMSVWHEAGGDEALIRHWIDSGARLEDPSLKAKYQRALELSPDEKTFADNVGNYFDSKWAELHRAGLLDAGLEDYVPHAWEPKDDGTTIATARIPGPDPTKGRVLPTYAAGEDAGFRAKQTDIGELLTKYEEVVGSKLAMARLKDGLRATNAADGKPLAVNERAPGYVQATGTGMQGLWLHADTPSEKIATRINNATGVGHLRDMPGMKAILGFQSTMKETMVSANPFHQIQIGIHGLEHKVNPFDLDPIDLTNERQQKLVRHSLTIGGGGGSSQEFRAAEGLTSGGGWLAKIPGAKAPLERYTRYVFGADGYIPRMKMRMALDALDRNTKRFGGKLTEDQIYHMTATQANAAFGGINYEFMGRNKTFREFMQLATFAPDFLEARTRFVGQALRPEGTEQRAALLRGAFVMYLGARVANGIFNRKDDGTPDFKFEPENMFSVVINGRRYGIRTVQGDVLHLLTDPRNFSYNRMGPLLRGGVELVTGRDQYGRDLGLGHQAWDIATTPTPFWLAGMLRELPRALMGDDPKAGPKFAQAAVNALTQAVAVQSRPEYYGGATKAMQDLAETRTTGPEKTPGEKAKQNAKWNLIHEGRVAIENGTPRPKIPSEFNSREAAYIRNSWKADELVDGFKSRPLPVKGRIWNDATNSEKSRLKSAYLASLAREISSARDPDERERLRELRRQIAKTPQPGGTAQ